MRNIMMILVAVSLLLCMGSNVYARGGTDCPPGSTDPDCKDGK